jgi:plastocyanin
MKKWLALLVLALALGLVVAGCGDDEEENGGGNEAAETQQDTGAGTDTEVGTDTGGAGGGGGKTEVSIGDNFFEPQEASVRAGSTVSWTNDGQVAHTVTKTGGPGDEFDSGSIEPGGDFETKVTEAGMVEYVCTIHAGQTGALKVE